MLKHLREQIAATLEGARSATLATTGPAGLQAQVVACVASGIQLYLLLPRTSDHLLNLEHDPAVVVTTAEWQMHGRAQVLGSAEQAAVTPLLEAPDAPWCLVLEVQPTRVAIAQREGWGAEAERAFQHVHERAKIESFVRKLIGRPLHLLPFRDVQEGLGLHLSRELGVREIPLDKIVGSVGKPDAFTPTFLPRYARLKEHWKRVYAGAQTMIGLPPIEVYQLGEAYFINDGHHRVSVARYLGATTMTAYVTEFIAATQQPEGGHIEELVGWVASCCAG